MVRSRGRLHIALGSDHAGFRTKQKLVTCLAREGHHVMNVGTFSTESTDYPDYAFRVAKAVAKGLCDRGVLVCGSGIGMAMAANKVKGIRAGSCWSVTTAKLAAIHNWCNVLCLSGRFTSSDRAKKMVLTWLKTPFEKGTRHERRIKKITKFESNI